VLLSPDEAAAGPSPDRAARGRLRIVVADDAVLLREGLVRLLTEDGHQVVATVGDGPALVDAVIRHRPDVSVVDVRMPPTHTDEGLRAAITAREHLPGAPMLVLSQYVEASYAADLLADGSGAIGYLLKDRVARVEEFLDALARVARGATVLDPQVIAQVLAGQRRGNNPLGVLTARERELLALMAEGHSNTAIAQRLVLSASAVEKHIGNIFAKLGLPPDDAQHRRVLAVLAYLRA
jgi:DNA-binding NarL/FixJ family response regulator